MKLRLGFGAETILLVFKSKVFKANYMSHNTSIKNSKLPSNLKSTLIQLEGTLSDWENITPDDEADTRLEHNKDVLEKELQKKARIILDQLKDQIEELSE